MPGDRDTAAHEGAPAEETKKTEVQITLKTKEKKPAEGGKAEGEKHTEQKDKNDDDEEDEVKEGDEPKPTMKSVVLTGFGGTKMLKVLQKPQPTPGVGQVLIRVKICGMGFQDVMLRQGYTETPIPRTPFIMGQECAGVIETLGPDVRGFSVGDRVLALTRYKAWAELVAVPETHVFKLPDNVSFQDGVCLLINYVTAYIMLFDIAALHRGQSLLLHSAAGGVGQAILQLIATVGDVTVYGTASQQKHDSIKNRVTHFLPHNLDYMQEINKLAPEGVDLVLDCLGGENTNRGISLLKPLGKYILYGSSCLVSGETKSLFSTAKSWWQVEKVSPMRLFEENRTIGGFNLRQLLFRKEKHAYVRSVLGKLLELHAQGKVTPVIDSVWAFEDVAEAMNKLQDRKNIGKVLLDTSKHPMPKETDPKAVAAAAEKVTDSGIQAGHKEGQKTQASDKPPTAKPQ